jgi:preprotein translocase subunit SecA
MKNTGPGPGRRVLDRWRGKPVVWRPFEHYGGTVGEVSRLGEGLRVLSDDALRDRAVAWRGRVAETFALVREVADRTLGLRPFDVQVLAGLVLYDGNLAEMATGEGKTLAAVAPVYLHALQGKGAHVLTFNDYLARRDAGWMGPIYEFLGMTVGVVQENMSPRERRAAYVADVTYATAKEVGFDYLRGLLASEPSEIVQRPFHYAIVDEADSILIDEARVPLVIAGNLDESLGTPGGFAALARELRIGEHYALTENGRNVNLTNAGLDAVERKLGIDDLLGVDQVETMTGVGAALHAKALLHRDVDYLVRDGRIELIDEFTGRVVEDRHLPDGLQAAVAAKEGLAPGSAGTVLDSITLQHLLTNYEQLAGMTATAYTACDELKEFYGMTTVIIPPNVPSIRIDHPDRFFGTADAKKQALVDEIVRLHRRRRPVLVGTASVAESERLAAALRDAGVPCRVLNARRDAHEAAIVADAGQPGAVTISTNMAGRGTDIRLGGADERSRDEVVSLGGLYVIGTNRHESRRIDNQLRGRAGRQGDPGSTRFFVSLEDPLLERFDLLGLIPTELRPGPGESDHPVVLREVERTQRIVEGQNLDIRRTLTKYSEMVEQQRIQLQRRRDSALHGAADGVERDLTLALIDRAWRDHLAFVMELRDSIHLRTVARLDPLAEFQKEIIEAFADLPARLDREVAETLERLEASPGATNLDDLGLRSPSSTWTYIVSDDPFRDQLFSKIGGTTMGLGIVINFPLVVLWAVYTRFFRKPKPPTGPEQPGTRGSDR